MKDLDIDGWKSYIHNFKDGPVEICRVMDYVYDKYTADMARSVPMTKSAWAYITAYEQVYGVIDEHKYGYLH